MTISVASSLLLIIAANAFSEADISSVSGRSVFGSSVVILSLLASYRYLRPQTVIFDAPDPPPVRRIVIPGPTMWGKNDRRDVFRLAVLTPRVLRAVPMG
jgi:hypothetical protein